MLIIEWSLDRKRPVSAFLLPPIPRENTDRGARFTWEAGTLSPVQNAYSWTVRISIPMLMVGTVLINGPELDKHAMD